jgi:hypothetical protein
MSGCSSKSLFDSGDGIIKYLGSDLVSIEGSNIMERLLLSSVNIPYKQVLKGRFILKPGEDSYLMNHLGLGNNATLVAMVVNYDPKSKLEVDNYIEYEYVTNVGLKFPISRILTLNGNSTHRIPQLYLSNPNKKYSVSVDLMVATVDDQSSEFSTIPPTITFTTNVFDYTGGVVKFGATNSDLSSTFFIEVDRSEIDRLAFVTLVESVTDDIDTIARSSVKFQEVSRLPIGGGVLESITYNVSVVDESYNLTEVELLVSIIN